MGRRVMRHLVLYLVLCSGLAGLVTGAAGEHDDAAEVYVDPAKLEWDQTNGPPGGQIVTFIQNPQRHNELFVLSENGDLYQSIDKGETWNMLDAWKNIHVAAIAVYDDKLFLCDHVRVFQYTRGGDVTILLTGAWNALFVSEGILFVVRQGNRTTVGIMYAKLTAEPYTWKDVSPSESELTDLVPPPEDTGLQYGIMVRHLVSIDARIFANIIMEVEGSGEYFNGYLYRSDDFGTSWTTVDLPVQSGLIISNLIHDPDNRTHLVVSLKHRLQDTPLPLSALLFESYDRGVTWSSITNLTIETTYVGDVDVVDSAYYITLAEESPLIKLSPTGYEFIDIPRAEGYDPQIAFPLVEVLFDRDNPQIVYGRATTLGLLKSEDGMNTWRKIDGDIIASSVSIVIPHPSNSSIMFTSGNTGHEAYLTRDGGGTWQPFSHIIYGDEFTIDPRNPDHIVFIDENSQIYESFDCGETWTHINYNFSSAKVVDFEIADDGTRYASNIGVGISQQEYGDIVWQYLLSSPDYVYDLELDPEDHNILYASYSPKIFENHSSIWRYSPNQPEQNGWSELWRIENTSGITALRFDPSNPNRIYAGVIGKRGAIYVSDDRGRTWNILNDHFIMNTIWGQPQLIVDPHNASTAYAATWLAGTWKTTDAGASWALLEDAPLSSTALSLNRENSDVIYLADRSSPTVWKSTDAGSTWEIIADFTADGALLVMRVLAAGDTVYTSTFLPSLEGGKLYQSPDAGATWHDITGTLPKGVLDIAVDPSNSSILYVTTNVYGAYKSLDGGVTWRKLDTLPYVGAYDIEVDPDNPELLHIAARGGSLPSWFTEIAGEPDGIVFEDSAGVYRSTDGGLTWSKILSTSASCRAIRRHPNAPNLLFAPDLVDGLLVSGDGGDSWTAVTEGLDNVVVTSVAVNDDKIYVGTQGCGVYSGDVDTVTGQIMWQPSRSNKPVPEVYSVQIEVDPTNANTIFVGSNPGGLYVSTDGGLTFKDRNAITPSVVVEDPLLEGYYTFAIDPSNPQRMWVGTWGKGIYKSYDAMLLDVPAGLFGKHIRKIVIDPSNPANVYVATQEGIFLTQDDGETWADMNEGLQTLDILSLKLDSASNIYVGTGGYGIYMFDEDRREWEHLGRTLGTGWWHVWDRRMYQFCSLIFDSLTPGKMYLGMFPSGFFISEDNGYSWRDSSLGLGNDGMFSLAIHPDDPQILWAGTYNGLAKTINGGATWTLKSNGWPPEQWPYTVLIDDENSDIMYATSKNGQNKGFCHRNTFCGVVMKTTDGGENWFSIMNGLDKSSEFYNILFHPLDHEILFMSTSKGVYMSVNAGNNWTGINNGLPTTENWVRDNVADNLALTADGKYLVLGIMEHGVWKADLNDATTINMRPLAAFTYSPDEPTTQDTIVFQDASEDPDGNLTVWEWDFGDGSHSYEQHPTHKYDDADTYTISLTVTDNHGSTDTISKDLLLTIGQPSLDPLIIITATGFTVIVISALIIIKKRS